jgi:hypothetical protein
MTVRDSITRTGARTPGAEGYPTSMAAHARAPLPTQCGITEVASTCAKDSHKPHISRCMPGAGLSRPCVGRCCPTRQPSSRIGENPPYGMIGRVEETSASFEARSAPRLYPTAGGGRGATRVPTATRWRSVIKINAKFWVEFEVEDTSNPRHTLKSALRRAERGLKEIIEEGKPGRDTGTGIKRNSTKIQVKSKFIE